MTLRTWHIEASFDAVLLSGVVLATTPTSAVAWLGAVAVWLSARHASVADRLREAEEARQVRDLGSAAVHCVGWLDRYWVAKEVCWIGYFVLLGAWPALVGSLRFLVWPWWRRAYRRWRPRGRLR